MGIKQLWNGENGLREAGMEHCDFKFAFSLECSQYVYTPSKQIITSPQDLNTTHIAALNLHSSL
jgi:hypothetical protein